jgi:segregation and condensation protein B
LPDSVIEILDVNMEIKRIVEAIIFAANRPMTVKQIQQVFPEIEQPETIEILGAIESITEDYRDRPIELKHVASGYRFQVRQELSRWVSRLFEEKPPRYSRALLETLAIIAYRQPVTRGDIEDIRGVSVSTSIIQTLLEREWIKVVAHKEAPGRPGLYGTTKQFLDYFNVTTLNDLPTLQEIQDLDLSLDNPQYILQEESEKQTPDEQDDSTQATIYNQEYIREELAETTAV